jgi:hypothetical protein
LKAHYQQPGEGMFEAFKNMLEKDTGRKILTMRVLEDHNDPDEGLGLMVVFKDGSILEGNVAMPEVRGQIAIRYKANWLLEIK